MCHPHPEIERFFQRAGALPAMPEVARRLLACFGDPGVSLHQLLALIARDAGLAARLLRLANTARFSPRQRVTRLDVAATMIGFDALRGLALGACLANAFPHPPGFDRLRFWCQNLATAGRARHLATWLHGDADTAEIAGLMLRSGELLMLQIEPGLTTLVEEMAGQPDSVFEVERLNFGCTHAEVSAELAVRWRFPAPVVDALFTAADPLDAEPFAPTGAIVRLASLMADAGCDGLDPLDAMATHQPALVARLGMDLDALRRQLPSHDGLVSGVAELLA